MPTDETNQNGLSLVKEMNHFFWGKKDRNEMRFTPNDESHSFPVNDRKIIGKSLGTCLL